MITAEKPDRSFAIKTGHLDLLPTDIVPRYQGHVKVITKLVIPAEAGIQKHRKILDSHFRGNDDNST